MDFLGWYGMKGLRESIAVGDLLAGDLHRLILDINPLMPSVHRSPDKYTNNVYGNTKQRK